LFPSCHRYPAAWPATYIVTATFDQKGGERPNNVNAASGDSTIVKFKKYARDREYEVAVARHGHDITKGRAIMIDLRPNSLDIPYKQDHIGKAKFLKTRTSA
jgi:hypothetical protein